MNENDIKALGIIKEARESGRYCCLSIYSDYDLCWEIIWVLAGTRGHKKRRTHCHDELLNAVMEFKNANK